MNRTRKLLVAAALPAVLATGVAAGVAFAQMPGGDHPGDNGEAMDMRHMMDPTVMQDHMNDVLGNGGYNSMLDAMNSHGSGMPMDMSDVDGIAAAMSACLGMNAAMTPDAPGARQHDEHHP